jgi:hypothetical protein
VQLIGPYLVACALLVVAGVAKAIRPDDTARALAVVVPVTAQHLRLIIRGGSTIEAALGMVALLVPRTVTAGLVAVSYLVFAGAVAYARSKGGAIASCGCFGTPDTPATMLHVVINGGLAASAAVVALAGPTGSIASVLSAQPLHGIPLVAASALCGWLAFLAITAMARLDAARRLLGISFRPPR